MPFSCFYNLQLTIPSSSLAQAMTKYMRKPYLLIDNVTQHQEVSWIVSSFGEIRSALSGSSSFHRRSAAEACRRLSTGFKSGPLTERQQLSPPITSARGSAQSRVNQGSTCDQPGPAAGRHRPCPRLTRRGTVLPPHVPHVTSGTPCDPA